MKGYTKEFKSEKFGVGYRELENLITYQKLSPFHHARGGFGKDEKILIKRGYRKGVSKSLITQEKGGGQ